MPTLPNTRHERFAQELAKGASQAEAYRLAGYDGTDAAMEASASRLVRNVKVAARVAELQAKAAERAEITVADITNRLLAIATKAEKSSDAPMLQAARASLMDAAKLNGLVIDKGENTNLGALTVTYVNAPAGPAPVPSEEDYETGA